MLASGRTREATEVVTVVGGAGLWNSLIKRIVRRPRPAKFFDMKRASGSSFPSGHASGTAALLGLAAVRLTGGPMTTRLAIHAGSIALTGIVARARVAKHAHRVSDTLAGMLLGYGWLAVVLWSVNRWMKTDRVPE